MWVGAVFVVVGLVLTFVVAIETSLETNYVAAFVAVIGIASLVVPKRRNR